MLVLKLRERSFLAQLVLLLKLVVQFLVDQPSHGPQLFFDVLSQLKIRQANHSSVLDETQDHFENLIGAFGLCPVGREGFGEVAP